MVKDSSTAIFDIVSRCLDMEEYNKGRYINKYLPPQKVDELLKELWALISTTENQAKMNGQKEMLSGVAELFEKIVERKREEMGVESYELKFLRSYFDWQRELDGRK